jgi:hypothetical protein
MISSTVSIAITNVIAAVICTPNDAPAATMIASTKTTPSGPWPHCDAITKVTHNRPFSHAMRTRLSSRRITDPPSVAASGWWPAAARIQSVCLSAAPVSTCPRLMPPGALVAPSGGPAGASRSDLSNRGDHWRERVPRPSQCGWWSSLLSGKIHPEEVERWSCAPHRRNQHGVKDRYRAAGSAVEQVLNWPGPGDHERNDARRRTEWSVTLEGCWGGSGRRFPRE